MVSRAIPSRFDSSPADRRRTTSKKLAATRPSLGRKVCVSNNHSISNMIYDSLIIINIIPEIRLYMALYS